MKKEIVLNSIEKKRNQFSAEFFSKGASLHLKDAFKSNFNSKINNIIDEIKKDKEKNDNNIKKIKQKNNKLKFDIKFKILAFLAIGVSAVVLFKELNEKFTVKEEVKKDIDNAQKIIDANFVLDQDFFSTNEEISKNSKIGKVVSSFNKKFETDFDEKYSLPIKKGVDFFLNLKNKIVGNNNYYEEAKQYLQEGQIENGIFGDYFQTIGTYALIHFINKRGYGAVLEFLNIKGPEVEGMDRTMWKVLANDRRMYPHLGRNIGTPSRMGDSLVSQIQVKNSILQNDMVAATGEILKSNVPEIDFTSFKEIASVAIKGLSGVAPETLQPGSETLTAGNIKDIQKSLSDERLKSLILKGIYKTPETFIKMADSSYSWVTFENHMKNDVAEGGAVLDYTKYQKSSINSLYIIIEKSKGQNIGGKLGFSTLTKIKEPTIKGYDKIVNDSVDYLNNLYPNFKNDKRVMGIITKGINYIVELYKEKSFIEVYSYTQRPFEDKVYDEKWNKIELGENVWKLGGALVLMQLVKVVAEWELYQSFVAAKTYDSIYNDFISDGKVDKIEDITRQIYEARRKRAEEWQIEYARGRKTLSEFITDYQNALGKILFQEVQFQKSNLQIKNKKIQIVKFKPKLQFKKMFNGLKDTIRVNLNSAMKKIQYGNFKSNVLRIGKRLIELRNRKGRNTIVINNETLRENFNLKRLGDMIVDSKHHAGEVKGLAGNQLSKTFIRSSMLKRKQMDETVFKGDKLQLSENYKKYIDSITDGAWILIGKEGRHRRNYSTQWIYGNKDMRLKVYKGWNPKESGQIWWPTQYFLIDKTDKNWKEKGLIYPKIGAPGGHLFEAIDGFDGEDASDRYRKKGTLLLLTDEQVFKLNPNFKNYKYPTSYINNLMPGDDTTWGIDVASEYPEASFRVNMNVVTKYPTRGESINYDGINETYCWVIESANPVPPLFERQEYLVETVKQDDSNGRYHITFDNISEYYFWDYQKNNWFLLGYTIDKSVKSEKSHAAIYNGQYDETSLKEIYNTPSEGYVKFFRNIKDKHDEQMLELLNERLQLLNSIMSENNPNFNDETGFLTLQLMY